LSLSPRSVHRHQFLRRHFLRLTNTNASSSSMFPGCIQATAEQLDLPFADVTFCRPRHLPFARIQVRGSSTWCSRNKPDADGIAGPRANDVTSRRAFHSDVTFGGGGDIHPYYTGPMTSLSEDPPSVGRRRRRYTLSYFQDHHYLAKPQFQYYGWARFRPPHLFPFNNDVISNGHLYTPTSKP